MNPTACAHRIVSAQMLRHWSTTISQLSLAHFSMVSISLSPLTTTLERMSPEASIAYVCIVKLSPTKSAL